MTETVTKIGFASTSALSATLLLYPLQTLEVRKQVYNQPLRDMIRDLNARQMYNGLRWACVRQFTYNGLRLGLYDSVLDKFKTHTERYISDNERRAKFDKFFCSLTVSSLASIVNVPIEALRVQAQTQSNTFSYKTMFRGSSFILLRNIGLSTVQLYSLSYFRENNGEYVKPFISYLNNNLNSKWLTTLENNYTQFTAPIYASVITTLIIHPLSVFKHDALAKQNQRFTIGGRIKEVYHSKRLYAGLGVTLIRVVPHFALFNWVYNSLQKHYF